MGVLFLVSELTGMGHSGQVTDCSPPPPSTSVASPGSAGPEHFWEKHTGNHESPAMGPAGLPSFLFLKNANLSFQLNSLLWNLKEF